MWKGISRSLWFGETFGGSFERKTIQVPDMHKKIHSAEPFEPPCPHSSPRGEESYLWWLWKEIRSIWTFEETPENPQRRETIPLFILRSEIPTERHLSKARNINPYEEIPPFLLQMQGRIHPTRSSPKTWSHLYKKWPMNCRKYGVQYNVAVRSVSDIFWLQCTDLLIFDEVKILKSEWM